MRSVVASTSGRAAKWRRPTQALQIENEFGNLGVVSSNSKRTLPKAYIFILRKKVAKILSTMEFLPTKCPTMLLFWDTRFVVLFKEKCPKRKMKGSGALWL